MMGLSRSTVRAALAEIRHGGFPWAAAPSGRADRLATQLRRRARRLAMARWPWPLRPFAAVAMGLAWPVTSLREAVGDARAVAPGALGGRSRWRLALAAWGSALSGNVPPFEHLGYRMFEDAGRDGNTWLVSDDLAGLNRALAAPEVLRLAQDKHAFSLFCAEAGVPVVPSLAVYARGEPAEPFAAIS